MLRHLRDRVMLGAALLMALASCAWSGAHLLTASMAPSRTAAPNLCVAVAGFAAAAVEASVAVPLWRPLERSERDHGWQCELFTPPKIQYDAASRQFGAVGARDEADIATRPTGDAPDPFGLELLAVEREPFRLQLVGHVGRDALQLGVFENVTTGEMVLAGTGRRFDRLELTVEEMSVRRTPVALPGGTTTLLLIGTAIVCDERSGERVRLTDVERHLAARVSARVMPVNQQGTAGWVQEGDLVQNGAAMFRIGKIQLAPPAVWVTKLGAGSPGAESRTLRLPAPGVAELPPAQL